MACSIKPKVWDEIKDLPQADLRIVERCIHNYSCSKHIGYRVDEWFHSYPDWKESIRVFRERGEAQEREAARRRKGGSGQNYIGELAHEGRVAEAGFAGLAVIGLGILDVIFSPTKELPEDKLKRLIRENS